MHRTGGSGIDACEILIYFDTSASSLYLCLWAVVNNHRSFPLLSEVVKVILNTSTSVNTVIKVSFTYAIPSGPSVPVETISGFTFYVVYHTSQGFECTFVRKSSECDKLAGRTVRFRLRLRPTCSLDYGEEP